MNRKKIFFLLMLFICLTRYGYSTDYYFSNVNGNDANSGETSSTPKKSMVALQSLISSLQPGDRVFLERGSAWYMTSLDLSNLQGQPGDAIQFKSYGSGTMPIISGEKILSGFSKSGNIYSVHDPDLPEITLDENSFGLRYPGYVTINGVPYSPGQTPNAGSYYKSTNCGLNYVSDDEGWSTDEFKDAFVVMKNVNWLWNIVQITENSSNNLTTTNHFVNTGMGNSTPSGQKFYFIQNGVNTLDQQGEWAQKDNEFSFYYIGTPQEVKIATSNYLITLDNASSISFEGISFRGANFNAFRIDNSSNISIENCKIEGCGEGGLWISYTSDLIFRANEITETNLYGILCRYGNSNFTIESNYIHRVAWREGYFNLQEGNPHGAAIAWYNNTGKALIEHNLIDTVTLGFQTHFSQERYDIRENLIRNYGFQLGDVGAFYSVNESYGSLTPKYFNRNILLDAQTHENAKYTNYGDSYAHAVYMDESSLGVHADSNSIDNCNIAYYTNGGYRRSFKYNKINRPGARMNQDNSPHVSALNQSSLIPMDNASWIFGRDTIMGNIIVLSPKSDNMGYKFNKRADYNCYFPIGSVIDDNHYLDPFQQSDRDIIWLFNESTPAYGYRMEEWKAATFSCANSDPGDNSTYNNTAYEKSVMFKNFSTSPHTFSLSSKYYDINNNLVEGTVTVAPFYSVLLFTQNGNANDQDLYIDESLVPFFKNDTGSVVPPEPEPEKFQAKINFTFSEDYLESGWHNIYSSKSNYSLGDGISLNYPGLPQGHSGEPQTIYPSNVGSTYHYINTTVSTPIEVEITGFDVLKTYTFEIFASRDDANVTEDRTTFYSFSNNVNSINPVGNLSTLITAEGLHPDSTGTISFSITKLENRYGYINALIVTEESATTRYSLMTSVEGDGSIDPSSGSYLADSSVFLEAVPSANWEFDHWSGDIQGSENPVEIIMNEDKNISAIFTEISIENDTIANWRFENDLTDETGVYNGSGNIDYQNTALEGQSCIYFDDPAHFASFGTINFTDSYRILGYYRVWGNYLNRTLFSNTNSSELDGFIAKLDGTTGQFSLITGNGANQLTATSSSGNHRSGEWNKFEFRIDRSSGSCQILINDVDVTEQSSILTDFNNEGTFELGREKAGGDLLWGQLDNVRVISAGNEINTYDLTLNTFGEGTIQGYNGPYIEGDTASLIAIPQNGWEFLEWDGDISGTQNAVEIQMTENKSITATFVEVTDQSQEIDINFSVSSLSTPSSWNEMPSDPIAGSGITNLINAEGDTTGYSITLMDDWSGSLPNGASPGLYPDNVMKSFIRFCDNNLRTIKLSNLNNNSVYSITFFSSVYTYNRVIEIIVNGNSQTLNAQNNISETITFSSLSPVSGEILISVKKAASSESSCTSLNAMVIEESPNFKEASGEIRESIPYEITLFPNPVNNDLVIKGVMCDSRIRIYNMLGEIMEDISTKNEDLLRISMRNYYSGNYIVKVVDEAGSALKSFIITKN